MPFQFDLEDFRADAYIVVFSVAHRDTFDAAIHILNELLYEIGTDRTTILVGNKADLVRKRKVDTEGKGQVGSRVHVFFSSILTIRQMF